MPFKPPKITDQDWLDLKERISQSKFRTSQSLNKKEKEYLSKRNEDTIRQHAVDLLKKRLAPAFPKKDGKQTPFHGHPVFPAQHATGLCCRFCLMQWHGIPKGVEIDDQTVEYLADILIHWIYDPVSNKRL